MSKLSRLSSRLLKCSKWNKKLLFTKSCSVVSKVYVSYEYILGLITAQYMPYYEVRTTVYNDGLKLCSRNLVSQKYIEKLTIDWQYN